MKKLIALLSITSLIIGLISGVAFASEQNQDPVNFSINEETDYGTPIKVGDTTMIPVRFAEKLGATLEWNQKTKTVTYSLGEIIISMTIGSKIALVNDNEVPIAEAPYLNEKNRTMVPIRMIAEVLGFTVTFVKDDTPIKIE